MVVILRYFKWLITDLGTLKQHETTLSLRGKVKEMKAAKNLSEEISSTD